MTKRASQMIEAVALGKDVDAVLNEVLKEGKAPKLPKLSKAVKTKYMSILQGDKAFMTTYQNVAKSNMYGRDDSARLMRIRAWSIRDKYLVLIIAALSEGRTFSDGELRDMFYDAVDIDAGSTGGIDAIKDWVDDYVKIGLAVLDAVKRSLNERPMVTRYADVSGGGKLNDAFLDAAYETTSLGMDEGKANSYEQSTFDRLSVGDTFDFIDDSQIGYNSFFKTCTKTGPRKYTDEDGTEHRVGSVKAQVHHLKRNTERKMPPQFKNWTIKNGKPVKVADKDKKGDKKKEEGVGFTAAFRFNDPQMKAHAIKANKAKRPWEGKRDGDTEILKFMDTGEKIVSKDGQITLKRESKMPDSFKNWQIKKGQNKPTKVADKDKKGDKKKEEGREFDAGNAPVLSKLDMGKLEKIFNGYGLSFDMLKGGYVERLPMPGGESAKMSIHFVARDGLNKRKTLGTLEIYDDASLTGYVSVSLSASSSPIERVKPATDATLKAVDKVLKQGFSKGYIKMNEALNPFDKLMTLINQAGLRVQDTTSSSVYLKGLLSGLVSIDVSPINGSFEVGPIGSGGRRSYSQTYKKAKDAVQAAQSMLGESEGRGNPAKRFMEHSARRFGEAAKYSPPDNYELQHDAAVLSDSGTLGSKIALTFGGKFIDEYRDMDTALKQVKRLMDKEGYFPNIYYVNDHGNVSLLNDKGKELASWV